MAEPQFNKLKNIKGNPKVPCECLGGFAREVGMNEKTMYFRMKGTEEKPEVQYEMRNRKYYRLSDLQEWHEEYEKTKARDPYKKARIGRAG